MLSRASLLLIAFAASAPAQASRSSPHWELTGGLHAGSPAVVSVAAGPALFVDRTRIGSERGLVLFSMIEPGLGAGRFSVGYADFRGNLGTYWTVRVTALRRWRHASVNYLGAELSIHLLGLGPRIGVFRPIGAGASRVTVDVGFGL